MNGKLTVAMVLTAGLAMAGLAMTGQAQARPYLMLAADDLGFKALDLGDIHQEGVDRAQITQIDAPLAGAPFGDKIAPLMKQRLEFECQGQRFRVLSISYADGKDVTLTSQTAPSDWRSANDDPLLVTARDAACLRRYNQALVSRNLNLGDIVTNYHRARTAAAPEILTEKQRLKQRFDVSH